MSPKGSAALLTQAYKDLAVQWQETQAYWHDAQALAFEKNYMEELPSRITRTLSVMEEIDTLLRKVRSDCE
ncbi:MAG: hypothetical protein WCH57_03355 [Verrucomicrobiota bacterium]